MLFDKETYTARRDRLKRQVKEGLILLFGNNDAPSNYPANVYKYRQDSSFLYFYGQHREGLVGVIDIDNHKEYLIGNDIDIEDIVWFGAVDSVADLAEIEEIERACAIGHEMHTTAMRLCRPGVSEQYIAGTISGIASAKGCMTSFPTILSMHGEIMHGYPSPRPLEDGRLMLCDAGAETNENYCSDNTRTTPINGRFTSRQRDIYSIVEACHDHVLDIARPGVKWWDVHMSVARLMTERLKELGLMKGDTEEAVRNGAHAMFFPHGLGHMMGMDVHDMEGLGQRYVGFDDEVQPSTQFGTNCLRCGRRLQEGWIMTDEPGIYFIPALIDEWKSKGIHKDFINFDLLETYKDFGGIRIEDDILITASGCRMLGHERIPYHMDDVEEFMAQRTN